MRVAPHPPHRSRRALLTHLAPALGNNAKAHQSIPVANTGRRNPSSNQMLHSAPGHPVFMAAAPQHLRPPGIVKRATLLKQGVLEALGNKILLGKDEM